MPLQSLDGLRTWPARLDAWVMRCGTIVANIGLFAQAAGFVLAFLAEDPIAGYRWFTWGFWIAGLGGAGLVYGVAMDAGGSAKAPGAPVTYAPSRSRWSAAGSAFVLTPLWAVLSLPMGILVYGALLIGGCGVVAIRLARLLRR